MTITRNIRRLQRIRAEAQQLERTIKEQAAPIFRAEGCLVLPRFERIIERFAR